MILLNGKTAETAIPADRGYKKGTRAHLAKVNPPRQSLEVLYSRVSGDRQTLLQVAQRDGSDRDWVGVRKLLSRCIHEEQVSGVNGDRVIYRVRPEVVAELAGHCVYVEQGK